MKKSKNVLNSDKIVEYILSAIAFSTLLFTAVIVVRLFTESWPFFSKVSLTHFFFDKDWFPLFENPQYGIFALISGTLLTTALALIIALPMGIVSAVFLSEYLDGRSREFFKPLLELLAAVPTVVYGYFALLFVTPHLKKLMMVLGYELDGFNALSAGLVMGLMIMPYICSLTEDAMRAVPTSLREASYGLGANTFYTAFKVVLPAAYSGVLSACVLAISRAFGETMVVAIAAGMEPKLSFNPLKSTETLTAYIVQVSQGDLPHGSLGYQTIYVVALVLFFMTYLLNVFGQYLRRRWAK